MSDSEGDEDAFAAMCEESEQALDLFRDKDDNETQTPDQEDMFAEMCADVEIGASPESPPPAESAWAASPAQSPQKSARDGSMAQHSDTDKKNVSPDTISAHAMAPELDDRAREKDTAAQRKRMETEKEQKCQERLEESCQPNFLPPAKAKVEEQKLGPAPPPPVFAQHCPKAPSIASLNVEEAKASSGAGSTLECKSDSGKVSDEVVSTRKAHPFTLQTPKVKLAPLRRSSVAAASKAKRLQKLHSELQDLSQRRQYQDAAKVFRRMKDLGGELSQARMSEADAKHNVVVKTLDTQEKDCLNALKRKWGARFEAFEKETQVQVDAQRKADAKERRELREETFESFREKPILFSATIMDLRQRELSLVKAQDYPQAKVLQEKIERLASEERQHALDTCLRNIEAAVGNLEAKQARTLRILQDRRNLQLERLKAQARSEEQAVWTRFQTAHRSVGLAHSLSRQTLARAKPERLHKNAMSAGAVMGMYKSSAAERKYEATLASITSLTARLHADEVRGFNEDQTAPDARKNARARTAPSGCVTGPRRRARTAGRKNDRKAGACHMCKRRLANSDVYVAIPRDYNRPMSEGIGQFCGWACAKSWNQSKSPPQLRWARELYMRTAEKSQPIARASSARERPSLTISTLSN